MTGFFVFIFIVALIALPISLIKPQIFSRFFNSTRTKNSLVLGGIIFASFILTALTSPTPTREQIIIENTGEKPAQNEIINTPTQTEVITLTPAPTATPTPTNTPTPTKKPTPVPTKIVYPTATPKAIVYPTATPVPQTNIETNGAWACDCSKTCPNISSCAEAQYLLNSCGCGARDGDNDGIACDGAPLHCQN